ncbi:hypothetical protein EYF80_011577 [Liparis tanakae]|uniref:Uncharacterized protein n=1 Tax=Liparis tanakae TaxID=230148 RepID=A0A4Z2ILJ7_9TELE|nr:hypothetical protein EYF80_011577 [Liparis tanakae]
MRTSTCEGDRVTSRKRPTTKGQSGTPIRPIQLHCHLQPAAAPPLARSRASPASTGTLLLQAQAIMLHWRERRLGRTRTSTRRGRLTNPAAVK